MRHPNCCGSEDGDVVWGIDSGPLTDAVAQVWKCNTCGVITIMDVVVLGHN